MKRTTTIWVLYYAALLWIAAVVFSSCSFSVFPKQELPKPDSSNVIRVDSILSSWGWQDALKKYESITDSIHKAAPIDLSDAPEPVVIPDNPDTLSDNPLISALANERDYYRDKLFTAKDALAERDGIIQRLQEQGRQQAAHIEKLVALVQQVRAEVKPVVQAAQDNNAALITGISMIVAFLIGKFFNKKHKDNGNI